MKKNLMAVLTASSVAVMAAGATLAAYAEPEQEQQIKDDDETYIYAVDSHCLRINTPEGFENWTKNTEIKSNEITTVSFADFSGEKIPDEAFKGCTSIENIVFPESERDNLIEIGKSAFEGCTSIKLLDFSRAQVGIIGESAFKDCTSIAELLLYTAVPDGTNWDGSTKYKYFQSSVTEIGSSAFMGCTGLMDIVFGDALKEIGESAFEGCVNLGRTDEKPNEETNGTDTIKWLHSVTFKNESSSSLETIGKRAFYGCEKLTAFQFPANVKTIGEYAFANCTSLYVADMWDCMQLTSIEKYAFFNCLSLIQVDFPECRIYNSNGYGYKSSTPKHTIAEGAFRNCSWLEGIILSPYVGDVAPGAFYKCKNLKYIGYYVNEDRGIGTNIEIKIDTEHSTQDSPVSSQISKSAVDRQSLSLLAESGEGSETVTVYVPPEVTVFAFNEAEFEDKTAVRDETIIETFWEKAAEEHPDLTYDGQIVIDEPKWKYTYEGSEGPQRPTEDGNRYISFYPNQHYVYYNGKNDDLTFDEVMALYEEEHQKWEQEKAEYEQEKATYDAWVDFLEGNGVSELWNVIRSSLVTRFKNTLYCVTLLNEPTSKTGETLDIVLPEKFNYDLDIYSITKTDDSVDIVDIPVKGTKQITNDHGTTSSYIYYDFSIMEDMGYEFVANPFLGPRVKRTYRDESDIDDPKASGLYGNTTGETLIKQYPVITTEPLDDLNPTSSSSTTTSPTSGNPPVNPINPSSPPSLPPTPNTVDPIEPAPEPSEPESSDPESSEPNSSEPESSEPESSEPESSEPEDNPPTGTRFLAPIALVGAAVVVVAARRRKMK